MVLLDVRWTSIDVDGARSLIYGPRTGRLYLLRHAESADRRLQHVLGLAAMKFEDSLEDPATSVAHAGQPLNALSGSDRAGKLAGASYRLLDRSRHVMPFLVATRAVGAMAARRRRRSDAPPACEARVLGVRIQELERAAGRSDCYPRALATAYLALSRGLACRLAVGVLAPTRKMHAWCSVEGAVPYEPTPEHHLYQPLIVLTLATASVRAT